MTPISNHALSKFTDLGILFLRAAFGLRLIYGTIDNVLSYDRMLEFRDFLEHHGFPIPLAAAFVSVILQFTAGISWIIGFQVRVFAFLMFINFIIAIIGVHIGDAYPNTAPAIHLLVVALFLFFNGGGKWSVDEFFKIRKVPGG
ncbi:DoxX family protein [Fulvivirgaceae bacterium BMA10]|uniref:DoxX family protein n=1 Tax=Splendidivirga corallicola TaxID=3051826 RepID=A0ABT8KS90_9BACT|nr:DoxX family protein [Fulvivirgaceae bacterium BMA10]